MKNIACIIARTNSKRLPNKALIDVNGSALIEYIINKLKKSKLIDGIYVCTSTEKKDKVLIDIADRNGVKAYAGSLDAPIERMLSVAKSQRADNIIRVTGDNVFTDETYIDLMLKHHMANKVDYTRTEYLPVGVSAEIISHAALLQCNKLIDPKFTEYLFLYMFQPEMFHCQVLIPPLQYRRPNWTLTVDTQEDYKRTLSIIKHSRKQTLNYIDILKICRTAAIPHLQLGSEKSVSFPAGVKLSYKAFALEKSMRISKAKKVFLSNKEIKAFL